VSLTPLWLTTCASSGTSSACSWERVIRTSDADVLSSSTARQIDVHNKTVLRICH
jgi:hypothetical protein